MERYRPPRRTGSSAGHPHGGPWSRVFVTGAAQTGLPCFSHGKSIRGGLTPGLPDEAGSLPAFAGSPWPDLPRCGPDRCSGPHPPVPALPTRTVPDPAPGRADDHHRMRGCAPDWERSFSPHKKVVTPDGRRPSGGPSRVGAVGGRGDGGRFIPHTGHDALAAPFRDGPPDAARRG